VTDLARPRSRPSLRKSTRPIPGDSGSLRRAALRQPVTTRSGVDLRAECWDQEGETIRSMREVVWEWRHAVQDNRDAWGTFEDAEGNQTVSELTDRFHPDKFDERYAKLNDLVDGLEDEYTTVTTVMLSLTASSTTEDGYARAPGDHFTDVLASNGPVTTALERVLEDRRFERIVLPEQHESGYVHLHWAVMVEGRVEVEDFESVIGAHVRNCPTAEWDGHQIDPDNPKQSAVSVREDGESLPGYLMAYTLGDDEEYGHDPLDASEERQMMYALLWAMNKRYWRPSDGAQSHMVLDHDVEGEWELIGIRDGIDGEMHEVDGTGGGVITFETSWPPLGDHDERHDAE